MQAGPAPSESSGDDDLGIDDEGVFSEINITPLTDVFLVLLIILMVVSSSVIEDEKEQAYEKGLLAERALQVMTPQGASDSDLVLEDVVISVTADRAVFVEDEQVPLDQLEGSLATIKAANPQTRVILRGDEEASYALIMDVLSKCRRSGLANVALASRDGEG